jgi:hypothetical protein
VFAICGSFNPGDCSVTRQRRTGAGVVPMTVTRPVMTPVPSRSAGGRSRGGETCARAEPEEKAMHAKRTAQANPRTMK